MGSLADRKKYTLKDRADGGTDVTVSLGSVSFIKGFRSREDATDWIIDREGASYMGQAFIDLTLSCPTCGQRADMCFAHGDEWKKRKVS